MTVVYVSKGRLAQTRNTFHSHTNCDKAKRGRMEFIETTPDRLPRPMPCKECYPDAPRAPKYRRCQHCRHNLPCRLSGGVLVLIKRKNNTEQMDWVWPDRAAWYEPVDYEVADVLR